MWVLFANLSVACLNHLLKVMNISVQLPYMLALYPSQCLTVVSPAPCVRTIRITTASFPSHITNICYINALILSSSTSSLKSFLSSHQKYAPTSTTRPPEPTCVSSHIRTVTELLQFLMPFYLPILWLVLLIL